MPVPVTGIQPPLVCAVADSRLHAHAPILGALDPAETQRDRGVNNLLVAVSCIVLGQALIAKLAARRLRRAFVIV